jgi:hypothetical protein
VLTISRGNSNGVEWILPFVDVFLSTFIPKGSKEFWAISECKGGTTPLEAHIHTISCNGVLNMDNELFIFSSMLLLFQIRIIPILFGEENSKYL